MKMKNHKLILSESDHEIILKYLESNQGGLFSVSDANNLRAELKHANVLNDEELPGDVVRLNSTIKIRDQKDNKEVELTLVTPKMVNIKERKISVMSPIGIALVGRSKGQRITWNVPAGKKTFEILDVIHRAEHAPV